LRRSRALISQVGQHVMVESGLTDMCSCATPVVREPGVVGRGDKRKSSLKPSTIPTQSTHILIRDRCFSSRPGCPSSIGFFFPSGHGEKSIAAYSNPSIMSLWVASLLMAPDEPKISTRTLPLWLGCMGALVRAMRCRDIP
jgi:hypothetical protein